MRPCARKPPCAGSCWRTARSAHSALTAYWAKRLGRDEFTALQASKRTGVLNCRLEEDRVVLGGHCQTVIVGQFQL